MTCTARTLRLECCCASLYAAKRKNGLVCGKAHLLEAKTDKGMENARFHSCTVASIFFHYFFPSHASAGNKTKPAQFLTQQQDILYLKIIPSDTPRPDSFCLHPPFLCIQLFAKAVTPSFRGVFLYPTTGGR